MRSAFRSVWEKNWREVRAAAGGGLPRFILARNPGDLGSAVPVFHYHVVKPEDLKADLEFLARNGYVTIGADALLDHLRNQYRAPARSVVLTFDDGPSNLREVVYPLLGAFEMKGVAFVATRFHRDSFAVSGGSSNGGRPLDWSQIREMEASGVIDFQSHTHEHRYVPRWPEPADLEGWDQPLVRSLRGPPQSLEKDLRESKETLERRLNKRVRHLAFPKFFGTQEALNLGRAVGYEAFWWGELPGRPHNVPGQDLDFVVRLDGRYLRRLPGEGRESLARILRKRYRQTARRLRRRIGG